MKVFQFLEVHPIVQRRLSSLQNKNFLGPFFSFLDYRFKITSPDPDSLNPLKPNLDLTNPQRNTGRLRIQIQRAYYRTVGGSEFIFHFPDGARLSDRPADCSDWLPDQSCVSKTFWFWSGIRWSMLLTNGSGSESFYFRHWPSRGQQKYN